jgi:hypothetical protein
MGDGEAFQANEVDAVKAKEERVPRSRDLYLNIEAHKAGSTTHSR